MNIKETFALALKNHKDNKLEIAENIYNEVLKINPAHLGANNNLGIVFTKLKKYNKAKIIFEKTIEIDPNYADAHYNLGIIFVELEEFLNAKSCYKKAIEINPNYTKAYYNLASLLGKIGESQESINWYEKLIKINNNHIKAHYNLGNTYKHLGKYQKALDCYERVIEIDHNNINAYNNQGVIFYQLGEYRKTKNCYDKIIEIDPKNIQAYWNLQTCVSNIDESLFLLKKICKIDNKHIEAKIMTSILEGYKGDLSGFNDLLNSSNINHPIIRSAKWIFSLPKLPKIYFNNQKFFDAIILLSENSRPFYEFGVWNGISFKYVINTFKKGFGFDTFSGLPEDWRDEKVGTYSSFGTIPKINGGEFIVGKFQDTLPKFFAEERPLASLINFDADLYSSTLCALDYSNKVIDDKTILVFDEFIINDFWEEDEYKALNEFCYNQGFVYEVLAVSFLTKQVAVKLKKF